MFDPLFSHMEGRGGSEFRVESSNASSRREREVLSLNFHVVLLTERGRENTFPNFPF
jgi:hypothetical protein